MKTLISIIVPMHNEAANVPELQTALTKVFAKLPDYRAEYIYVDDGSTDTSVVVVEQLMKRNKQLRLLRLSRNFGKEVATSAGLHAAKGEAALMIDADLQHPPQVIPELIKQWEAGFDVVVGVRDPKTIQASFVKRLTSRWFYRLTNAMSSMELVAGATDFRLLDRVVIDEFNRLTERNRMTRSLIDWLGFSRAYVQFTPGKRSHGQAAYSYKGLIKLATNSIVSLSFFPLKLAGYLGAVITIIAAPLGIFIFLDRYILNDPFHLNFTGTAMLAVMLLFLVGIVLICQGLMALYIANIYSEVQNRPLYIERRKR